ncbi:MAG: UbiA family prenyltransferase [Cryomorphaceae bacterium]
MLRKIWYVLKLTRWFHELLGLVPFVTIYLILISLSEKLGVDCATDNMNFAVICLGVQLLMMSGFVLNDIKDRDTDSINKPTTRIVELKLSLGTAKRIYWMITLLACLVSIYIGLFIFPAWLWISPIVFVLSIGYSLYFKRWPLVGNIVIAAMASAIPLVILMYFHDCIERIDSDEFVRLIYIYSAWPFMIIVPRELSLDISDYQGDEQSGCKTLPVVYGVKFARKIVLILLSVVMALTLLYGFVFTKHLLLAGILDALLLFYVFIFLKCETRIEYIKAGRYLWFVMIVGIVSVTMAFLH